MRRQTLLGILSPLLLLTGAVAQTDDRAAEIEASRQVKSEHLVPLQEPPLERRLEWAQSTFVYRGLTGQLDGFGFGIGQMVPGAGFGAGPQYQRRDLFDGRLTVRALARVSTKRYYLGLVELSAPDLWAGKAFVDFQAGHRYFPQMPYYGSGSDSRKTGRSNYLLEDSSVEVRPGLRPIRRARIGAIGGYLAVNIGRGTSSTFISSDQQFGPVASPGIDRQTNFWRGGGFAEYDWRDRPGESTRGGYYKAEYLRNLDRQYGAFSFYRLNLEAQQHVSIFNGKRVLSVRAASSLTDTRAGQSVPFYLQPTLGGPDDLRGFRAFRFYGNNSISANAEYKWEVSPQLDLAVFIDGGKVFNHWDEWNFHHMESSAGAGFRVKSISRTVLRFDVGFSHEGFQLWFRMNDVFGGSAR